MSDHKHLKYGIVVDSGSSGSRLQIYQWEDPHNLQHHTKDKSILNSVPKLIQQEDWSFKTSPGISSFEDKPGKIWNDHFKHLVEYLEKIIPKDKQAETPFFVLATAGMRLVQENKRNRILNEICTTVHSKSNFFISDCQNQVQVIDGETEGIFGWIGLNYLMGQFNNYDKLGHGSYGFMDMGGASTQIAFVPSDQKEIDKHGDDLFTVTLRNVNGENQDWKVFVSTWLGFGANHARRRHLRNAVTSLPDNIDTKEEFEQYLVDPCSPKGAKVDFKYNGKDYTIRGLGNYEYCLKDIYPLLLKHLPCKDDPCLFNGVHAPLIDFEKDKFVGISEYWYTANDVFDMGGEYSFLKFNEKVKEFCSDDWDSIMKNFHAGKYGKNMKLEFLIDSCFKASWVINVLHEGFGLPRIGLETNYLDEEKIKSINEEKTHVPFQSASLIEGAELSWTLGKMLLYVSSEVEPEKRDVKVGIIPSDNSVLIEGKQFVPGNVHEGNKYVAFKGDGKVDNLYVISRKSGDKDASYSSGFLLVVLCFMLLLYAFKYFHLRKYVNVKTVNKISNFQLVQKIKLNLRNFYYTRLASQETIDIRETNLKLSGLEEGLEDEHSKYLNKNRGKNLRTRSSIIGLSDMHSAGGSTRPHLQTAGSTSSVGSLLDFQKNFHSMNFNNKKGAETPVSRNNSVLDFNKLRTSITNQSQDLRRNVSSSKLQTD